MRRARGFTLLEVLVALAIFALVAASVLVASSRALQTAARLEDKTFAAWVAENHMQELQLSKEAPAAGKQQGEERYAGRNWRWQSRIESTSEPLMLRVTIWVAARAERGARGDIEDNALASLTGFLRSEPL